MRRTHQLTLSVDWTDKKQVDHAQKIAQQYTARKCGSTRDEKRPSYHPEDTQWITDYITAKMKLTKAEAKGIDWGKFSQSSPAIKQITAEYNARDCVVNGNRVPRTPVAIFQKITRMSELRPLRGMDDHPKKRKFQHNTEEDVEETEEEEASPPGSATKKVKSDRDRYVSIFWRCLIDQSPGIYLCRNWNPYTNFNVVLSMTSIPDWRDKFDWGLFSLDKQQRCLWTLDLAIAQQKMGLLLLLRSSLRILWSFQT